MKIDLSVDYEEFKNQIENLREELNKCQESGILIDGLEEKLNQLMEKEERLLSELVPYYRVYAKNIAKTSMEVKAIKELGGSSFHRFMESGLRINDNLYLISSTDGRLQFFHIDASKGDKIEVEWSFPIKEIKETICFMHKLNEKEIILFGFRGNCYLLSIGDFEQMPHINSEIDIKKVSVNYRLGGFRRCLEIAHNLFIVENEEKLNLLEIIKEDQYNLFLYQDIYITIPNWTTMEKINNNYFAIGTKTGEIYFVKYENDKFNIIEKLDIMNEEIRQIKNLEDEDGSKNSLIAIGNRGQLRIFSLDGDIKVEIDNLEGNLFEIQSEAGTGVVLSEDGIVYLLEEDFNNWNLNEEIIIKNTFFISILKLDISKYLLMDVDGKLNLLNINRITAPEDLWSLPLY